MTDPKAFFDALMEQDSLRQSELAQQLMRPYQAKVIEQLAAAQNQLDIAMALTGKHPDFFIIDEAADISPEMFAAFPSSMLVTNIYADLFDDKPPERPAPPATLKERERQHWTSLNGGNKPWKKRR